MTNSPADRSRRENGNVPQIGTFMETAGIEPALRSRRGRPRKGVECREIGAAPRTRPAPRHRRDCFDAPSAYRGAGCRMIYLAGEPEVAHFTRRVVKIGYAQEDCASRVAIWQIGNPRKIQLIAELAGDQEAERRLHRALRPLRLRGEWFLLTRHMVQLARAKRIATADEWLAAVQARRDQRGRPVAEDVAQYAHLLDADHPTPTEVALYDARAENEHLRRQVEELRSRLGDAERRGMLAERADWERWLARGPAHMAEVHIARRLADRKDGSA